MRQFQRLALVAALVAVTASVSLPQAPGPKPMGQVAKPENPPMDSTDQVIRATVNIVIAPTTVTEKNGTVVNGLKPSEFRLYDNGKLQEIQQDIGFLPLSLVIAVQRNADVEGILPKLKKVGTLLQNNLVGEAGEAAILAFDHRINLLQDFTNDPDKLNAAMEKLTPGSTSSRLVDAVNEGVRMLRNKRDRRKVILLISETRDKASEASFREVATNVQIQNVDVFTLNMSRLMSSLTKSPALPRTNQFPVASQPRVGIAPQDPTSQMQRTGAPGYGVDFVPVIEEVFRATKAIFVSNPAEVLTKYTGGKEYSFMTQADLEQAIIDIGAEIRSQYLLSYNPNNKSEGGYHTITVDVLRPGLKVRTRPGYWMAAVP